jgi:hypothetical protein
MKPIVIVVTATLFLFPMFVSYNLAYSQGSEILKVDFQNLISRADLHYQKPVDRSEAGMPLGNGRMGSLVWTSPTALKLQINRVDVFASNRNTSSFNYRESDYGHGCGFLDIDFVDYGEDIFTDQTQQRLGLYDGLMTVKANNIDIDVLAWQDQDVMAFQIEDKRSTPTAINVKLRMLRPPEVFTKNHSAISTLEQQNGYIVLKQEFKEGAYYCTSAVVVGASGRASMPRLSDETGGKIKRKSSTWRTPGLGQSTEAEIRLAIEPAQGSFEVLVASAASFHPNEDVVATAIKQLENARSEGFKGLLESNKLWWHDYWSKAFVHLSSPDGVADEIEKNYTYFLYLMAASSRGDFPLDFSGMIFKTLGDMTAWGHQQWWNNICLYYQGFYAANRLPLMDPLFRMYGNMYEACKTAASQMWGSQGIFIPETVWFDGPEEIPEDLVEEVQAIYLGQKSWVTRSPAFNEFAETRHPLVSLWNWKAVGKWVEGKWIYSDKGIGPFGHLPHLFESGPKIAYLYWKRYEYTLDQEWLRTVAYPMLKGVTEFYRNFPNLKKENDGKYHLHLLNNSEGIRGARDPMGSMAALYGILPVTLKASEILGLDAELREKWKEFYENLAPMPTSDHPDAPVEVHESTFPYWINAVNPILDGTVASDLFPCMYFDLCNVETAIENPGIYEIAQNTYNHNFPGGMNDSTKISVMSKSAVVAAKMGRANDVKYAIPNQINTPWPEGDFVDFNGTGRAGVLENRMTLREGVNAIGAERLGNASYALHEALCQSNPSGPAKESVIRVFPAWPDNWNASFTLLCRGGFLVTSSQQKGEISFVEIRSMLGGVCLIRNPWLGKDITLYREGKIDRTFSGDLLNIKTEKNEDLVLLPDGLTIEEVRTEVSIPEN